MTMTIMPAMLISSISIIVNGLFYLAVFFELIDGKGIIHETTMAMLKSCLLVLWDTVSTWFHYNLDGMEKNSLFRMEKNRLYHHFSIFYVYLYTYFYRSPV